ncbi:MAG TPA: transposase [Bacteroidales bacterium]|nr:transposase [Bacteroidales bacterium]
MMSKVSILDQEKRALFSRRFSDDFKKKKVKELETNLVSINEICKTYGVSRTAVYKWIYKFSIMAKKNVRQVVEAKSDTQKIKMLEERIKELERVIGKKQLEIEFKDKMIEIAGIDKKKLSSKLSSGTPTTDPNTGKK